MTGYLLRVIASLITLSPPNQFADHLFILKLFWQQLTECLKALEFAKLGNQFLIRRAASLLKCLENRARPDLRRERRDREVLGVSVPGPAHPEKPLSGVLLL